MRTLAFVACLSLLALALAGCADDKERPQGAPSPSTPDSSTATGSSTGTTTGSSTQTSTGAGPNRAPTGSISVALNGTTANFTLAGTDPDGDDLSWTLAFGDGNSTSGTSLPANVTHTYAAAGNLTALYNLTDRESPPVAYNVTVALSGASTGPVQSVTGEVQASNGNCVGATSVGPAAVFFPEQMAGVTYLGFAVDAATVGKAFTVAFVFADGSVGGLLFTDAAGATLARHVTADEGQTAAGLTGDVPAGATLGYLFGCLNEPDPVGIAYEA